MRAVTYSARGPPPVFELIDIEVPTPRDDEVLVKVHATGVNSWDAELMPKEPSRVSLGKRADKRYRILGADVAGTVESVGSKVTRFRPGDAVFGDLSNSGWGGYAEFVCARDRNLMLKPEGMTFVDAAATPQAGLLAFQALRKKGGVQAGDRVLINGAGGGVGTFAIQICRAWGAEVTGVDREDKFDLMRSLGAAHVIDYREEDFTKSGSRYDFILDPKTDRSMSDYKRALNRGGAYVTVGGKGRKIMSILFLGPLVGLTSGKRFGLLILRANRDLDLLTEMIVGGKVRPIVDRTFPLEQVGEAIAHIGDGHVRGKVVITVIPDGQDG
ncbi:MAG: NAD(P)-dependent alcohol dehydrogenase [Thermoplasmata archaeon]|nr:MAG: NAD(P)-dependent alcohol dehydrogenase [Thermoplasmata archaeon]